MPFRGCTVNDTANVAPTVSISATATDGFFGVRGQIRSFTRSTSDSVADIAAGFNYTINWGDGATRTLAAGADAAISHIWCVSVNAIEAEKVSREVKKAPRR